MNKEINSDLLNLIAISKIDKEASAKEPEIFAIEDELNSQIRARNALENTVDELKTNIKKARVDIANCELAISENNEKIAQLDKKMAVAKSERELRALDAENGLAKEKITFSNEQIHDLETKIEALQTKENELTSEIARIDNEIIDIRKSVNERVNAIKEQLQVILNSKSGIAQNIDNKVLIFYEKIRKWAKDSSIVPVKKQACSGCYIRINDRIYLEILKRDSIVTCPHCGRILYIDDNIDSSAKPKVVAKATKAKKPTAKATKATKATKK